MKTRLLTLGAILLATAGSVSAQTLVTLDLQHKFNGNDFSYGTTYTLPSGQAVSLSRVQYYMSGFELTHDGGQTTAMPDAYVLGSGNISSYTLGSANITTLEAIDFDLGVDSASNHLGTSNWPSLHPLASQAPTMDWGWPAGYFFFTIDGLVDSNGDGTPNSFFEMHGFSDALLRDVATLDGMSLTGSTIDVTIYVNVADWLLNNHLASVGSDHSASVVNVQVADNTNDETVFTLDMNASSETIEQEENHIFADYSMPYAPTLFYDLNTTDLVDIKIIDMNGQEVLSDEKQNPEGNYFIRKELNTGTYIAVFTNGSVNERFKFVVQK